MMKQESNYRMKCTATYEGDFLVVKLGKEVIRIPERSVCGLITAIELAYEKQKHAKAVINQAKRREKEAENMRIIEEIRASHIKVHPDIK